MLVRKSVENSLKFLKWDFAVPHIFGPQLRNNENTKKHQENDK